MKKVIFNADDFGFSRGVNKGIADCMKKGVISSISLLTNMPATEDALSITKKNNLKNVGIHLNITDGRSLTGRSTITDKNGNFIGAYRLLLKLFLKKINIEHIKREFKSQIEVMINKRIVPDHINSHMYIHSYKPLSDVCIGLAKKYHIKNIRNSYDSNRVKTGISFLNYQYYKLIFINRLARFQKENFRARGIKTTDYFHGILQMGSNPLKYFVQLINQLPQGTHEIMCHPGYPDKELKKYSPYIAERKAELTALCSPALKRAVKSKNIQIVGFNKA